MMMVGEGSTFDHGLRSDRAHHAHRDGEASKKVTGPEMATAAPRTGYAPVNGLDMYDEIHGTGPPLVLPSKWERGRGRRGQAHCLTGGVA